MEELLASSNCRQLRLHVPLLRVLRDATVSWPTVLPACARDEAVKREGGEGGLVSTSFGAGQVEGGRSTHLSQAFRSALNFVSRPVKVALFPDFGRWKRSQSS